MLGLFISLSQKTNIKWNRKVPKYILLIPLLLIISNIFPFFFSENGEALTRGILQSLRRVPAVLLIILLLQTTYEIKSLVKLCNFIVFSVIVGAVLSLMLTNNLLSPFSSPNELVGNPVYLLGGLLNLPQVSTTFTNFRLAGNTGSPTTYGAICSISLLLVLKIYIKKEIKTIKFVTYTTLLLVLLIATAAKAVFAATFFVYAASILAYSNLKSLKTYLVVFSCLLALYLFKPLYGIFDGLIFFAHSSSESRFEAWNHAAGIISENPSIILFGEGWRTRLVGWHSEIIELLMGFGLFVGTLLILIEYIYIPWKISRITTSCESLLSNKDLLGMYSIILFASLFQDVFHDGNILFVFVIVLRITLQKTDYRSSRLVYSVS